jgi:hypothetical protein
LTGNEPEAISQVPGEHVQMDVKNFLTGSRAVSKKSVHRLASQTAAPNSCGQTLSNDEHPAAVRLIQIDQPHPVDLGDDQQMTRVYRVDVTKSKQSIIFVHYAGIRSAGHDAAEHIIHVSRFAHSPKRPSLDVQIAVLCPHMIVNDSGYHGQT